MVVFSPHSYSKIEMSEEVFLSAILYKALPRKDTLADAERRSSVFTQRALLGG